MVPAARIAATYIDIQARDVMMASDHVLTGPELGRGGGWGVGGWGCTPVVIGGAGWRHHDVMGLNVYISGCDPSSRHHFLADGCCCVVRCGPDMMKRESRDEFVNWYHRQVTTHAVFDFCKEIMEYCRSDVDILRRCCLKFRTLFQKECGLDPFFIPLPLPQHVTKCTVIGF